MLARKASPPIEHATRHTAVIRDPASMWSKLAWDVEVFRDIQVSYPDEPESLAYAAVNVCIAAWSLRNWVESVRGRNQRRLGIDFDRRAFFDEIAQAIPEQAACDAIANTAKHARLNDGEWAGGRVSLDWQEGDEDCPPGYVLHHFNEDGRYEGLAVNRFVSLCDHWWTWLEANAMAIGMRRIPDWQQRKLRRIFGDRP